MRPIAARRPQQQQQQQPVPPRQPARLHHQQQQRQRQQQQQQWNDDSSSDAAEAQPPLVLGKSVAEEAAEAAAGDAPLDLVGSLASMLCPDTSSNQHSSAGQSVPLPAAIPSPGAGGSSGLGLQQHNEGSDDGGAGAWPSADVAPAELCSAESDPEAVRLLQLQFPGVHELVADTALRMHGGSLQAAAQFLSVLEQQGAPLASPGGGGGGGAVPQAPTLGAFFQGLLPEAPEAADACSGFWDDCSSSSGAGAHQPPPPPPHGAPPASAKRVQFAPRGQTLAAAGRGGGRGGRGGGRRAGGVAGDDPMSVAERQAMNTHLSAKRLYTQVSPTPAALLAAAHTKHACSGPRFSGWARPPAKPQFGPARTGCPSA
jgi:hypothetical protein